MDVLSHQEMALFPSGNSSYLSVMSALTLIFFLGGLRHCYLYFRSVCTHSMLTCWALRIAVISIWGVVRVCEQDFCYYANVIFVVMLLYFPTNDKLFLICFSFSEVSILLCWQSFGCDYPLLSRVFCFIPSVFFDVIGISPSHAHVERIGVFPRDHWHGRLLFGDVVLCSVRLIRLSVCSSIYSQVGNHLQTQCL